MVRENELLDLLLLEQLNLHGTSKQNGLLGCPGFSFGNLWNEAAFVGGAMSRCSECTLAALATKATRRPAKAGLSIVFIVVRSTANEPKMASVVDKRWLVARHSW